MLSGNLLSESVIQQQQQQKSVWSDILSSVESAAVGPCDKELLVLGALFSHGSAYVRGINIYGILGSLDGTLPNAHDKKANPPLRYSFESLFLDESAASSSSSSSAKKDATGLELLRNGFGLEF